MKQTEAVWVYLRLFNAFGPQRWWPGETQLEIIIGAVLTQNTAWANVEKAIENLRREGLLDFIPLLEADAALIASSIRPAGYYNLKAERVREVLRFISEKGGIDSLEGWKTEKLRNALLGIRGVGPETADSILLYAFGRAVFVVDAYTKRIFNRLGLVSDRACYEEVQRFFETTLEPDTALFNEYHALIVRLGKECCKKTRPLCQKCPVKPICSFSKNLI